jgi:DNA-binding protein HU-beta
MFLFRLCIETHRSRKRESLTICVHPVQEAPRLWRAEENRSPSSEKALAKPESGRRRCETGFRRGFSQLTFAKERAQYSAVRFPNSALTPKALPVPAGHERDLRGKTMNKADLVDKIAGACEISKAQATTAIDTAVDSVTAALRKGDRVALIGFGTFSVSQRKARNGRNPQTGATIKIAARKVAKFTPGAELKKAVNKK